MSRGGKDAGFTLLEVIIALGIMTVGMTVAISLFTAATAAHRRAVDRIRAIEVSEQVFASLEGSIRDGATMTDLIARPPWKDSLGRWPGVAVEVRYGTIPKEQYIDELMVEVHVQWISRGLDAEEVFQQIVARTRSVRLPVQQ